VKSNVAKSLKDQSKGGNSVSMMVLAKLDNSLLQQPSSSQQESMFTMAKTGGFQTNKLKGNKVLTNYFTEVIQQEKRIPPKEEVDRR